jgi:cytosine/adenosine deaminase-related metal-dependent hydrolase
MPPTIISAGTALLDTERPPQRNVAVLVEGNQITAVGAPEALQQGYPTAEQVGGAQFILAPAMVNAHDHGRALGSTALGVVDDLLEIWLPGLWGQPNLDPYLAAAYDGLRMLRAGVGTVAHSHNPRSWLTMAAEVEPTLRGYRDAGIRVAFHPPIIDQNPLVYADRDTFLAGMPPTIQEHARQFLVDCPISYAEYAALIDQIFQQYHDPEQHLVHIQLSPAGGQWCSDELIMHCVAQARRLGTRVQMHMLETYYQMRYAHKRWGTTFIQHLDALGALGPWLTLAHMVWPDLDDLALLAERGVGIVHNPSSNLRLRSGIAPLPEIARSGVSLGIGLDGHGLDDDQDYLRELRLAWTIANRPGAEAPNMPARDIWHMATQGGAAITFGETVPLGKLAPGFLADLVLYDLGATVYDERMEGEQLRSCLLRLLSRQHVQGVMINGRWVVRAGRNVTLDEAALVAELRAQIAAQPPAHERSIRYSAQAIAPYLRRFYQTWNEHP